MARKLAFVLASSNHGTMIVNRLDYRMVDATQGYGVGFQILETGTFDLGEVKMALKVLGRRRHHHGDGVVAIDCGANIGVHTVEWANAMTGWGSVLAIEAQERIFYALAGNIAINNCFNAYALHAAVSSEPGTLKIPNPNYLVPSSFGSLELRQRAGNEFIGQIIDYEKNTVIVRKLTIDEINLARVDFIKIDIEGMEMEALEGGRATIEKCLPVMLIEKIKADSMQLVGWLEARGYKVMQTGINLLAIHSSDKTLSTSNRADVATTMNRSERRAVCEGDGLAVGAARSLGNVRVTGVMHRAKGIAATAVRSEAIGRHAVSEAKVAERPGSLCGMSAYGTFEACRDIRVESVIG